MTADSGYGARILGSRATVTGTSDSLESINTFELDNGAIVVIISNLAQYVLDKLSTDAPSGDDIVAPAQGGPGRWFKYPTIVGTDDIINESNVPGVTLTDALNDLLLGGGLPIPSNSGAELIFFDGSWYAIGKVTSAIALGDADATLDVNAASAQLMPTSAVLTGDRDYTLPAPAANRKALFSFSVYMFGTPGAFSVSFINGPSATTIYPVGSETEPAYPYRIDFSWDGGNWSPAAYCDLTVELVV
jgi:hypothetical protein